MEFDVMDRICAGCGAPIEPGDRERNRRKWCSQACRVRAFYQRHPERRTPYRPVVPQCRIGVATCRECGNLYITRRAARPDDQCCRRVECRRAKKARDQREGAYRQRWVAKNGQPESKRANNAKRRAARRGAPDGEMVSPLAVAERDGWACGICGDAVDETLAYPHPLSKSIDHIQPVSLGGLHTMENVRLAHLVCNVRRGAREAVA